MIALWFVLLFVVLPLALCMLLVAALFMVELIDWRRGRCTAELLEHLTREGEQILQRERR